jgi:hypothetical protein
MVKWLSKIRLNSDIWGFESGKQKGKSRKLYKS